MTFDELEAYSGELPDINLGRGEPENVLHEYGACIACGAEGAYDMRGGSYRTKRTPRWVLSQRELVGGDWLCLPHWRGQFYR